MYWRMSSFPELDHLSDAERCELLRRRVILRGQIKLILLSLLSGVCGGVFTAGLFASFFNGGFLLGWLVTAPLWSILVYQIYLIRIRGQLLLYLQTAASRQRLPMCLRCGYNLEGVTSGRCPECGTTIPKPIEMYPEGPGAARR